MQGVVHCSPLLASAEFINTNLSPSRYEVMSSDSTSHQSTHQSSRRQCAPRGHTGMPTQHSEMLIAHSRECRCAQSSINRTLSTCFQTFHSELRQQGLHGHNLPVVGCRCGYFVQQGNTNRRCLSSPFRYDLSFHRLHIHSAIAREYPTRSEARSSGRTSTSRVRYNSGAWLALHSGRLADRRRRR